MIHDISGYIELGIYIYEMLEQHYVKQSGGNHGLENQIIKWKEGGMKKEEMFKQMIKTAAKLC